jgi:hypothetical protein
VAVQLEEDVLRQLFGDRAVPNRVIGEAEHHPFVLAHEGSTRLAISLLGPEEGVVSWRGRRCRRLQHLVT